MECATHTNLNKHVNASMKRTYPTSGANKYHLRPSLAAERRAKMRPPHLTFVCCKLNTNAQRTEHLMAVNDRMQSARNVAGASDAGCWTSQRMNYYWSAHPQLERRQLDVCTLSTEKIVRAHDRLNRRCVCFLIFAAARFVFVSWRVFFLFRLCVRLSVLPSSHLSAAISLAICYERWARAPIEKVK